MRRAARLLVLLSCLPACAATDHASPFAFVEDAARGLLALTEDGRPVLAYAFTDQLAPGVPADRARSCYVHPIHGLDGEILTQDFPTDHLHHRGLSLMWPRLQVGGRDVDQWHLNGLHTRFLRFVERSTLPDRAVLEVEQAWTLAGDGDGRGTGDAQAAVETLRLEVQRSGVAGRVIDVSHRIVAGPLPVRLLGQVDKGYGGFNLRFAERDDTRITTEAGPLAADEDHGRHRFADLSARFGGREARSGIAVLVAPDHPDYPPPWTLRHYGDLNVAWPGLEPRLLAPGEEVTLSYRLLVHRGDADEAAVAAACDRYVAERPR